MVTVFKKLYKELRKLKKRYVETHIIGNPQIAAFTVCYDPGKVGLIST